MLRIQENEAQLSQYLANCIYTILSVRFVVGIPNLFT